jgi:protein TonB
VPVPATPQSAPPVTPRHQDGVVSTVAYLVPPNPIYPARSRQRAGVAMVQVLIDVSGRPTQVSLQGSSGHSELDESALSAVRAAQFRPYAEGALHGRWVLIPIKFVLK